jgi:hypothetical protein
MVQNVVIRGKKSNGAELPVLVDADGKIETTATLTGDIEIGEVEVSNFPASQVVEGTVTVDEIEAKVNIDTVDQVTAVTGITNKVNIDTVDHITAIDGRVGVYSQDEYGWEIENTPQGEHRAITPFRLIGSQFSGTTTDTNFWTVNTGTGGSATQANQLLTIANGTTDGNDVSITSVRTARYVGGSTNRFRANMIFGDTGAVGNTRRFGAYNTTDGFFFELSGTTFRLGIRKASGDTTIAQASWSTGETFTVDTNMHTFEIYWTNKSVWFSIDDELVHKASATTAPLVGSINLPITMETINGAGVTTSYQLKTTNMVIHRLGTERTQPTSKYIAGASAGTICKYSAGIVQQVIFFAGSNGNGIELYDNTAASGTPILKFNSQSNIVTQMPINLPFFTGLTVVTTGSSSYCTIIYE